MGDIADSIIDGEFDYYTGEYLGKPCGYPRTQSKHPNHLKNGSAKGVDSYLQKKGLILRKRLDIVDSFFIEELKESDVVLNMSYEKKCKYISSKYFNKFANFIIKCKNVN